MKELIIVGVVLVALIVLAFVIQHFWTRRVVTLVSEAVTETIKKPAPVGCSRCREIVPAWFLEQLAGESICFKCTAVYPYPKEGQTEDDYTVERQRYMEQQRSLAMGATEQPNSILDEPPKGDT
jgi:hypothetical protein